MARRRKRVTFISDWVNLPLPGDVGVRQQRCRVKSKTQSTSQVFLHLFFLCSLVRVCIWWLEAWICLLAHSAKPELRKVPRAIFFFFHKWHSCLCMCFDHLFCLLLLAHAGCQTAWAESSRQNRWSRHSLLHVNNLSKTSSKYSTLLISPSKTNPDKKPFQWILVLACESQTSTPSLG